jgi:recombination protein RecA
MYRVRNRRWAGEIADLGSEAGVIEKSGAFYAWKGERIGQGRGNACQGMQENPPRGTVRA